MQNHEIIGGGRTVWTRAEDGIYIGRFGRFSINVWEPKAGRSFFFAGTCRSLFSLP